MQNACIAEATKLGAFADEFRTKSNTHYRAGIKFSHHVGSTCGPSPERSREPVSAGAPCSRPGVCEPRGRKQRDTEAVDCLQSQQSGDDVSVLPSLLPSQVGCRSRAARRRTRASTSAWPATAPGCATRPPLTFT